MVIVTLADIHGHIDCLEESPRLCDDIARADLILIAGDITDFGGWDEADEVFSVLRKYNTRFLAVTGNCDRPGVGDYLTIEDINLHENCVNIDGVTFVGLGGSLPLHGMTPNEVGEDEFARCLKQIESMIPPDARVVFLTHQPAIGTAVDALTDGEHRGSNSIRDFIERTQPMLAISGHVHEAVGTDRIDGTRLVNPGPLKRGTYAYIEITDKLQRVEIRTG